MTLGWKWAAWQRAGLAAALIGIVAAVPVAAAPLLPQIVDPPSSDHHVGKVIFLELVTPDLAAAERFYGTLFGWRFRAVEDGKTPYAEAFLDGHAVAGLIQRPIPADGARQPAWLSFVSVLDAEAATTAAVRHGATVLFAPRSLPDRGSEAILRDPQGAVFAVLASSSGDPPDVLAAPGDWIWHSLITSDPDTDAAFYQMLFGYDVFDVSDGADPALHLLLASGGYARASANTLPPTRPDDHPHWLGFIRVVDAIKTAATVTALGGRVVVEPRIDRHGGRVAVVADPQGAPFGLLEWPDTATAAPAP